MIPYMKRVLQLAILFIGIMLAFLNVSSVYAASVVIPIQKASQPEYTIKWLDDQGHIAKTWRGSVKEAEKIKQREETIRYKLLPLHLKQSLGVSPNSNRVDHCTLPNDFLDFRNEGLVCFANDGEMSVLIYDVYEVDGGNNSGWFLWCYAPSNTNCNAPGNDGFASFSHNQTIFPPLGKLWDIADFDITGR